MKKIVYTSNFSFKYLFQDENINFISLVILLNKIDLLISYFIKKKLFFIKEQSIFLNKFKKKMKKIF